MPHFYRHYLLFITLCLTLVLGLSLQACSKKPNPGIEVGNPTGTASLKGLLLIIDPERSNGETYELSIITEFSGVLTRFTSKAETLNVNLENVTETSFTVRATFADGTNVRLEVSYSSDNKSILSVELFVNEVLEPATFNTLGDTFACNTDTTNGAEQLSQSICNRIVSCTTTISCADCNTGLNNSDQLTDEFGLPFNDGDITFGEVISQVDSGSLSIQSSELNNCLTDINNLTCDDISGGFSESFPNNYQNIENFIPEGPDNSCPLVFQ
ncbi:MAG: hypothetical protein KDK66_02295 [Deltaproteobacteria bacterium]|nr:hypothetical protein [Deltaproteobacteria bacterium]